MTSRKFSAFELFEVFFFSSSTVDLFNGCLFFFLGYIDAVSVHRVRTSAETGSSAAGGVHRMDRNGGRTVRLAIRSTAPLASAPSHPPVLGHLEDVRQ